MTTVPNAPMYRRLILIVIMTLLGAAVGFAWGREFGYRQGKADTVKAIENRLNQQPAGKVM